MLYDIIIIGAGISGLYTAYKLSKKHPQLNIIILEKANYIGGRIETYEDKYMKVEAGAGRFSNKHKLLLKLIEDLGLKSKIKKSSSTNINYIPIDYTSLLNYQEYKNSLKNTESSRLTKIKKYSEILKNTYPSDANIETLLKTESLEENKISSDMPDIKKMIFKVIYASKMEKKEKLQKMNFVDYALKIIHKTEVELIKDSFGYYSELVIMNAYDSIKLLEQLYGEDVIFYSLKDGLSQIIEKILNVINKNKNIQIHMNHEVESIVPIVSEQQEIEIEVNISNKNKNKTIIGKKCICALPKEGLEKIGLFKPIKPLLNKINSGSLCRIYSQFDRDRNGELWFEKLTKFTTNNNIRMVIPYDYNRGIIMISYSDNKFADYWNDLYTHKGVMEVNRKLQELLMDLFDGIDIKIPMPKHTKMFYWKYGVGYWGMRADSNQIAESILQPFEIDEILICGENYSENNQQWIEGALDTSEKVISLL